MPRKSGAAYQVSTQTWKKPAVSLTFGENWFVCTSAWCGKKKTSDGSSIVLGSGKLLDVTQQL